MTHSPALLYIAHRIPYPPNKGDKIRTFNEIRYLSRHFSIDLVALVDDPDDFQYKDELASYCRTVTLFGLNRHLSALKGLISLVSGASISQGYFGHGSAKKRVAGLLASRRFQAIVCFSSPSAGLLPENFVLKAGSTIMDFCDVDSEKWRQYAQGCHGPMRWVYKLEARRLRRYEIELSGQFDASVFVSKAEADLFRGLTPFKDRVHGVSNGVDFDFFSPPKEGNPQGSDRAKEGQTLVLMFPGAMDYHANVQGVSWFAARVMPKLCRRLEKENMDLCFYIVGKNPVPEVRALAENDRIRVTGFVEDIRPYYEKAHAVVIPLQVARGIQNKVLEGMAMARPVVATPQAMEGILATEHRHFKAAATAEHFVEALMELALTPETGREMGARARGFIKDNFSWDDCLDPLVRILHGKA